MFIKTKQLGFGYHEQTFAVVAFVNKIFAVDAVTNRNVCSRIGMS
jgi:hypothetical protein